jgi:four helix bundle protein
VGLVTRFEDLEAWREARKLVARVYRLTGEARFRRDFGLADQIRRAAVSTMNNIAEGFDSGSRIEFRRFIRYAARSASEVQSCLYAALDQDYIDRPTFESAYALAQSVRKLCNGLARRLGAPTKRPRPNRICEPTPDWLPNRTHPPTGAPAHRRTRPPAHRLTGTPAHRLTGTRSPQ